MQGNPRIHVLVPNTVHNIRPDGLENVPRAPELQMRRIALNLRQRSIKDVCNPPPVNYLSSKQGAIGYYGKIEILNAGQCLHEGYIPTAYMRQSRAVEMPRCDIAGRIGAKKCYLHNRFSTYSAAGLETSHFTRAQAQEIDCRLSLSE
jgi:hypothetical protein